MKSQQSSVYFSEQSNNIDNSMWEKMEKEARIFKENIKRGAISFTNEPKEDIVLTIKYSPDKVTEHSNHKKD